MHLENDCYIVDCVEDLDNWTVLSVEEFKPAVFRLHVKAYNTNQYQYVFRLCYCSVDLLAKIAVRKLAGPGTSLGVFGKSDPLFAPQASDPYRTF
jgi:hypothetical protein